MTWINSIRFDEFYDKNRKLNIGLRIVRPTDLTYSPDSSCAGKASKLYLAYLNFEKLLYTYLKLVLRSIQAHVRDECP